jgi:hypothetical protein
MDGIPWQVVAPVVTAIAGGLGWACKKAWTLVETHAERRTKAVEAIAPSIKVTFDGLIKHVTEHADEHAKAVEKAESNILAAVNTTRASLVEAIGFSQRLERVESAVRVKDPEDPTLPERSDPRPSVRRPSGVQSLRDSRPAIADR